MHELQEIFAVFIATSMVFKWGIVFCIAFGFSFFKSVTLTSLGGMLGSVFYVMVGDKVIDALKRRRLKRKKNNTPQRNFTRRNKLIIKTKNRFGLVGISVITPWFSYPLGCYLAVRYFKRDKQKIIMYLFASTLFWSIVVFSYKLFF